VGKKILAEADRHKENSAEAGRHKKTQPRLGFLLGADSEFKSRKRMRESRQSTLPEQR
jgi:hypothetical protein